VLICAAEIRTLADRFGTEWILLPNAMYGDSFSYAKSYGFRKLFSDNVYVK
jgi:predicted secreted acid phosphatase